MAGISIDIPESVTKMIDALKAKASAAIPVSTKATLSKEAIQLTKILKNMMGNCDSDVVVGLGKILSVMTGEDIKIPKGSSGKGHVNYRVVVPIGRNPNSHDYLMDTPVMICHGDMGFESTGRIGNHLPAMGKYLRDANEGEVTSFFDELTLTLSIGCRQRAGDEGAYLKRFASDRGISEVIS